VRRINERFAADGGTVAQMMAMPVGQLMSANPTAVHYETLASAALSQMENHQPRPIFIVPVFEVVAGTEHLLGLQVDEVRTGRGTNRSDHVMAPVSSAATTPVACRAADPGARP
jgi:hypothetical protein